MGPSADVRPTSTILTDATVLVLTKGLAADSGQGMLAISPGGCFYMEGQICRAISLDELEMYIKNFPIVTEEEIKIVDFVMASIASCRGRNKPS